MKATGIVRRADDLERTVIPKEIRRTLKIREGDLSQITLTAWEVFCQRQEGYGQPHMYAVDFNKNAKSLQGLLYPQLSEKADAE